MQSPKCTTSYEVFCASNNVGCGLPWGLTLYVCIHINNASVARQQSIVLLYIIFWWCCEVFQRELISYSYLRMLRAHCNLVKRYMKTIRGLLRARPETPLTETCRPIYALLSSQWRVHTTRLIILPLSLCFPIMF
jgi:hypothetical protein